MLKTRTLRSLVSISLLALLVACGGGDETAADSSGSAPGTANAPVATSSSSGGGNATPAPSATGSSGAAASTGGGDSPAVPACQLMTRDEASAALGANVGDPEARGQPSQDVQAGVTLSVATCRYSAGGRSVTIGYEKLGGAAIGQMRQAIRQQFEASCPQSERVTGVGDVACWSNPRHIQLMFLKGTTSVTVGVFQEITDPDRSEALKTVAQTAAGRLQ